MLIPCFDLCCKFRNCYSLVLIIFLWPTPVHVVIVVLFSCYKSTGTPHSMYKFYCTFRITYRDIQLYIRNRTIRSMLNQCKMNFIVLSDIRLMVAGLAKCQWQQNPTPLSRIIRLRTYNVFDTTRDVLWIVSFVFFFFYSHCCRRNIIRFEYKTTRYTCLY